jgi:hypothetical protein
MRLCRLKMEELLPSHFGKQGYQDQQRHTIVKGCIYQERLVFIYFLWLDLAHTYTYMQNSLTHSQYTQRINISRRRFTSLIEMKSKNARIQTETKRESLKSNQIMYRFLIYFSPQSERRKGGENVLK